VRMVGPTALLRSAVTQLSMKMNSMGGGGGKSRPITLNGHSGYTIETNGQVDGRQATVRGRIYLVQNTVYQIYWVGPASRVPDLEIQKMFDSFKLTDPPPPAKKRKGRRMDPSKPRKSRKKPTGKKPDFEFNR